MAVITIIIVGVLIVVALVDHIVVICNFLVGDVIVIIMIFV